MDVEVHPHFLVKSLLSNVRMVPCAILFCLIVSCSSGGDLPLGMTAEEFAATNQTSQDATRRFNNLLTRESYDVALDRIIEELRQDPQVASAEPSISRLAIVVNYKNGLTAVIVDRRKKNDINLSTERSVQNRLSRRTNFLERARRTSSDDGRALVLEADPDMGYDGPESVESLMRNALGSSNVTYRQGDQVTIELLLDAWQYRLVYFNGHGTALGDGDNRVVIATGEEMTPARWSEYYYNTEGHVLDTSTLVQFPSSNKTFFGVTSDFFKKNAAARFSTDSVVYMDSCESLHNQSMADAFFAVGVSAYLGWTWNVSNFFGGMKSVADSFFSELRWGNTVGNAVAGIPLDRNIANLELARGQGKEVRIVPQPPCPGAQCEIQLQGTWKLVRADRPIRENTQLYMSVRREGEQFWCGIKVIVDGKTKSTDEQCMGGFIYYHRDDTCINAYHYKYTLGARGLRAYTYGGVTLWPGIHFQGSDTLSLDYKEQKRGGEFRLVSTHYFERASGISNPCYPCVPTSNTEECSDSLDSDCDGDINDGCDSCQITGGCFDLDVPDEDESPTCTLSAEVCDGEDNDCDGEIDEGVKNDCGGCGAVQTEVCDGNDNDCDGTKDDGACPYGQTCERIPFGGGYECVSDSGGTTSASSEDGSSTGGVSDMVAGGTDNSITLTGTVSMSGGGDLPGTVRVGLFPILHSFGTITPIKAVSTSGGSYSLVVSQDDAFDKTREVVAWNDENGDGKHMFCLTAEPGCETWYDAGPKVEYYSFPGEETWIYYNTDGSKEYVSGGSYTFDFRLREVSGP